MKFPGKFKTLNFLSLTLYTFSQVTNSQVVYLSGSPTELQREITEKFLSENHIDSSSLISWDLENTKCLEKSQAVLQLCFWKENIYWVTAKPKVLKRTFGHIIKVSEIESRHKPKKPSNGGQL